MPFIVMSIFLGLLPESIYFCLLLIFSKNITERRWVLFGIIFATDLLLSATIPFSAWNNAIRIFAMYGALWATSKADLIDVFLSTIANIYLAIVGVACYFCISNYWLALSVNRLLLLSAPILFRHNIRRFYCAYRCSWNRRSDSKIKSITVRNISLVTLNVLLYAASIALAYMESIIMK